MPVSISSAARLIGPNPPGLALVIPIPADLIISMPEYFPAGELQAEELVLKNSQLHAFWTSDIGGEYQERMRADGAGHFYALSAEFNHIGPGDASDAIFQSYQGREFCLLVTTLQGKRLLLGTRERPLQLEVRKSTGSLSGVYGYQLALDGEQLWKAPRFLGQLVAGDTEVPPPPQQMRDFSPFDFSNSDFY